MKKLFALSIILLFIGGVFLLDATAVTPFKTSTVPATTVYWGKGTFHDTHYNDTLLFSSDRDFSASGESTAVFVSSVDCTGKLNAIVLDDSSVIIKSDTDTDSTKSFWYLIYNKAQ
ncbi:MAG: hypothetical protein WBB37_07550 [bacterium]